MLNAYLSAISLIERLHRQFLDVVKAELDGQRIRDINNVQALILFNIGQDELDRRRADAARLLSWLQRFLQCEEDGRARLSDTGTFRT